MKTIKTIEDIRNEIKEQYGHLLVYVDGGEILVEEDYEMDFGDKNDDDCCDAARENGESIVAKFPMLEVSSYYCHRHKYAIATFVLKPVQGEIDDDNTKTEDI